MRGNESKCWIRPECTVDPDQSHRSSPEGHKSPLALHQGTSPSTHPSSLNILLSRPSPLIPFVNRPSSLTPASLSSLPHAPPPAQELGDSYRPVKRLKQQCDVRSSPTRRSNCLIAFFSPAGEFWSLSSRQEPVNSRQRFPASRSLSALSAL